MDVYNHLTTEFDDKIFAFGKSLIKEYLDKCTELQQSKFNRIYGSLNEIPKEKMKHAYFLCKRTVEKNNEK